jgi:galactofuranose transport system ATP-binding protein
MTAQGDALLRTEGISKQYGAVQALHAVDFEMRSGEVRALVGENGAGKSTLIKIITGTVRPSSGRIWMSQVPVEFGSPRDAQEAGIAAVHQEVPLLEMRSVAENVFFGREPRQFGLIRWSEMYDATRNALHQIGAEVDPRATVRSLKAAQRQMVAIARCVSLGAKLLVLDEPTSSLNAHEVDVFLDLVRRLQANGTAVILVSHRFDELYAVSESVTVLRDGRAVRSGALRGMDRAELVRSMLGTGSDELRSGLTAFGSREGLEGAATELLRARNLSREPVIENVSVDVRSGEIVGLAGLLGSGRTEIARAIFGADRYASGTVTVQTTPVEPHSPRAAIHAGLGFVSEDRKLDGIVPEMSVADNLTLSALPLLSRLGFISRRRQQEVVAKYVRQLRIKVASPAQKIRELSGGNQQKVLLARWLCRRARVLILDDPTRGVDIAGRAEIQTAIRELAEGGAGVLLISSELDEIVEASSRTLVLRNGRVVSSLRGHEVTREAIMKVMAADA